MAQPDFNIKSPNFIYYPSLSAGASRQWLRKNYTLKNNITSRFYNDDYPEKFRHKYFLVTAGHHYKNPNLRNEFGLGPDVQVLGDSGGFQLATGAIKWKPELTKEIFDWLEGNCDIAMNLDLPPRVTLQGKYDYCLDISKQNFRYFETNQTGKVAYLNVLQGDEEVTYSHWYNEVKGFNFSGWAFGNCRKINNLFYALMLMLDNGEFKKDSCKYLHILGASKVYDFFIYEYLQKLMNQYTGNKIQLSTDSSSPGYNSVFGGYYIDADLRNGAFLTGYFGRDTAYNMDSKLPCLINCEGCKDKTYRDIFKWNEDGTFEFDTPSYMIIVNHNTCLFVNTVNDIKLLLDSHDELMKDYVDPVVYQLCKGMREMFESTNRLAVYEKYKPIFAKYNSMNNMNDLGYPKGNDPNGNDSAMNTFFDFN